MENEKIKTHKAYANILSSSEILKKSLNDIQKIDFKEKAFGKDPSEKLKLAKKHYLVTVIDEVLRIAELKGWQLCVHELQIYVYNGIFWNTIKSEEFQTFLGLAAEKMGVDRYDAKLFSFREELFKQFINTAYLPNPEKVKNLVLLNCKNGTLEITEKGTVLRKHKPEDFLTYVLSFEYNEAKKAPIFEKFLNEVLEDEKQKVLAEYFAYIFISTKVLKLEKVLMLYGGGSNGKSVIYEIMSVLLGSENVTNYSLENLTDHTGYYRAMISGKLLNYASEISNRIDPTIFKQIASGETITGRLPYGKPINVDDYAKLIFNTNDLPRTTETTHAFFRRFLIIHFDKTIPEEQQDKELANKIIETELSGVLNWILQGLQRLLNQKGFTYSKAIEKALNAYKVNADEVRQFLNDNNYQSSESEVVLLQDLYNDFKVFCYNEGYIKIITKQELKRRLSEAGISTVRRSKGFYVLITNNK